LAPRRDAVKITNVLKLGQGLKLLPVERHRVLDLAMNLELPTFERYLGVDS